MVTRLVGKEDRERARAFLEAQALAFEEDVDDLVGVFARRELVAVGGRRGGVLKGIAVAPAEQGGALWGEVVTALVTHAAAEGRDSLVVFTTPANAPTFERFNFELLASAGRAALLECGGGFARWLESHRASIRAGRNGAVVVNCNPFTLGHRHLIEQASREVDTLYVFVVREDRSAFPFHVRLPLVREGTRDLPNVVVLDTSRYAVSAITFPSYFLRRSDDAAVVQMELDLTLFARRIAPFFGVATRFVGTEPFCEATRAYNGVMRRLLPALGVEVSVVSRAAARDEPISASRVRALFRDGRTEELEALVPRTTAAFLRSPEAHHVLARLRAAQEAHG
jgi:[citrate (pro-3S)-lyase] ligase